MRIRAVNSIGREDRWIDQFVTNVDCKPNVAYNLNYKYNLNPKLLFFWFHSIFEYFCCKKRAIVWDNFCVFMLNIQVNILQSTPRRFSFRSFPSCYYMEDYLCKPRRWWTDRFILLPGGHKFFCTSSVVNYKSTHFPFRKLQISISKI